MEFSAQQIAVLLGGKLVGDENRKIARWRRVFTIYMPLAACVGKYTP